MAESDDVPRTRRLPEALRVALQMALGAIAGVALMAALVAAARLVGLT